MQPDELVSMHPRTAALLLLAVLAARASAETKFAVDPEAGNNTFTAVFADAAESPRTSRRRHEVPRTIRSRARIEGFDRERYRIGPRWTDGWLARVQQLAPVVATEGTIEVNLFAMETDGK